MFSGVLSRTNTKTQSLTQIFNPKAALSAASRNKQCYQFLICVEKRQPKEKTETTSQTPALK